MKGDPLPNADHILRYAGGSTIDDGTVTGTAFLWSKAGPDDAGLSVNWMEKFEGTTEERVQRVRDLARLTYGATAKLAQLNVARVKTHVAAEAPDTILDIIEDPLPAKDAYPEDPSHAAIANLPDEDTPAAELIGDLIAECVEAIYPARKPSPG
jgi:hypothetical protein